MTVDADVAAWVDGAERAALDLTDVLRAPADTLPTVDDLPIFAAIASVAPMPALRQPHPADRVWVWAGLAHQPVPEIQPPVTVCGIECGRDASMMPAEFGAWDGLCPLCFGGAL